MGTTKFAHNLRALREDRDYSIRELCKRMRIKEARYKAWEEGRAFPHKDLIVQLCDILEFKDIYKMLTETLAFGGVSQGT